MIKLIDATRFVYWNPSSRKDIMFTYDTEDIYGEFVRSRIELDCNVLPPIVPSFNADLYYLLTISDIQELNREWDYDSYVNSYGQGDYSTYMMVGGIKNTKAILGSTETTYAKITIRNN